MLFSGLLLHAFLAEVLTGSSQLILSNTSYVKKVVFPLEILPWILVISALFHFVIGLSILIIIHYVLSGIVNWQIIFVPFIMLPYIVLMLGLSLLFSSLGVYLRDLGQLITMLTTVLLFMAPILYPLDSLPENLRDFIYLNPISFIVEELRVVLIGGGLPDFIGIAKYLAVSIVVFFIARTWFQYSKKGFSDVM